MAQRAALPADVSRNAVSLARAMTIGLRSWGFYPPEHPAVGLAVDRLIAAATDAASGGLMQVAVTPHALLIDGVPLESGDMSVSECAAILHDRDILQMTVVAPPSDEVVRALLTVLTLDRETRRARGGPAAIWNEGSATAILLEQIDYQEILERDFDEGAARRDATWKSIVRSIIVGRRTFTAGEQQRLVEVARDVGAIGELCKDAREPFCTPDGAPLVTTQAATVLAVYRHLLSAVTALEPDRANEVMGSLALAAGSLDATTQIELLMKDEPADDGQQIAGAVRQAFDDQQIALLLARAVAAQGYSTGRLAQVLDTLAPDADRKRRVLALAKRLISERDMGGKRPIDDMRQSLDELLLKYDESTYVSTEYRLSMEVAASRAADLAARSLPPELAAWLETLGHDSVRRLSGQLLIDLLRNEASAARMAETAKDMAGFVEELLLAGVYAECLPVIEELGAAATRQPALAPDACRHAIDAVARSSALAEAAAGLADQTADEFSAFARLIAAIGPSTAPQLIATYQKEDGGIAAERASTLLMKLGAPVINAIAAAIDDPRWFVQRELARVLGQIGTSAAIAPLQSLLRKADARVMQAAVSALVKINDPAAVRALHTALKSATGDARAAVITALVGLKNARVVPMLTRILQDSDPFGPDHPLVLDMLSALGSLQDDRAIPPVAALVPQRRWLAWGKTTRLRDTALRTLLRLGTPKARAAFDDFARTGDFFVRRMVRRLADSA